MTYLLDVNVLIALIDPGHVQHEIAHDWFLRDGLSAWANLSHYRKRRTAHSWLR